LADIVGCANTPIVTFEPDGSGIGDETADAVLADRQLAAGALAAYTAIAAIGAVALEHRGIDAVAVADDAVGADAASPTGAVFLSANTRTAGAIFAANTTDRAT
jgi:hypothetical protein